MRTKFPLHLDVEDFVKHFECFFFSDHLKFRSQLGKRNANLCPISSSQNAVLIDNSLKPTNIKLKLLLYNGFKPIECCQAAETQLISHCSLASNNKGKLMISYWVQKWPHSLSPSRFLRTAVAQRRATHYTPLQKLFTQPFSTNSRT